MSRLADSLLAAPWSVALDPARRDGRILRTRHEPEREGRTVPLPGTLEPSLRDSLRATGIETLFSHQDDAFEAAGRGGVVVTTPTAHELILQVQGHGKLDVALVYEANCTEIKEQFDLVPIDHPLAQTIQNMAVARKTPYPALARRLMDTLLSAHSRERFEASGFSWKGAP